MTGNIPAQVAAFSTVIVLDKVLIPFMFTENIPGPGCSSVILLVKNIYIWNGKYGINPVLLSAAKNNSNNKVGLLHNVIVSH